MQIHYRKGNHNDLQEMKALAIRSWSRFKPALEPAHWNALHESLSNDNTYLELLEQAQSFVCYQEKGTLLGMAFLVPSGHPTDIYDAAWSYIRFVTVDPGYGGQGIGRRLTTACIEAARSNGEQMIALHTSELMNNARQLYENMGFTVLKEIPPRLGKRYWLYTLALQR